MNSDFEIKCLNFNTAFRNSGSLFNPGFFLGQENLNNTQAIKLKSAIIPHSFYTIDNRNNKIYFSENGGSQLTATLVSGNYTSSTISAAIKTALEAAGNFTFDVSYSSLTNKITIQQEVPVGGDYFTFFSGLNSCYIELGIINTDLNLPTGQLIPSECINLSGPTYVNFVSNIDGGSVVNSNYSILASISMNVNSNEIAYYQDNSSDYINIYNRNLSEVYVLLYDEYFRPLTPRTNFNFTINFLVQ